MLLARARRLFAEAVGYLALRGLGTVEGQEDSVTLRKHCAADLAESARRFLAEARVPLLLFSHTCQLHRGGFHSPVGVVEQALSARAPSDSDAIQLRETMPVSADARVARPGSSPRTDQALVGIQNAVVEEVSELDGGKQRAGGCSMGGGIPVAVVAPALAAALPGATATLAHAGGGGLAGSGGGMSAPVATPRLVAARPSPAASPEHAGAAAAAGSGGSPALGKDRGWSSVRPSSCHVPGKQAPSCRSRSLARSGVCCTRAGLTCG